MTNLRRWLTLSLSNPMDSTEAKLLKKTLSDYTGEITASAIHSFNTRHSLSTMLKVVRKKWKYAKLKLKRQKYVGFKHPSLKK